MKALMTWGLKALSNFLVWCLLMFAIFLTIAILATPAHAADISVGLHLESHHFPERDYQNNRNPGVYVRVDQWQAGCYHNTLARTTCYGGYIVPIGPLDLMAGAATGYQEKCTATECLGFSKGAVTPMVALSYLAPVRIFGAAPRAWVLPPFPKTSTVVHLSLEWSVQ